MSQLISILDSIFKTNGGTTRQWRSANEILLTHTDEVKKYVAYMKNKIRDLNKNTQLLALDFLDYSIDDGKIPLWTQVGSKDFLTSLVNLYKTRSDEEVQNKILYLIKKWSNKFQKYNTIIPNFNSTYENLKNNDIEFPDDMESTYEKYLQGGNSSNTNNNIFQNKEITSENKNYLKRINLDLRTSSYERKYKRLVNKLDDWTQQIQDANVLMDMVNENGFDDELRGLCNDLESGKGQLIDTIESGKLKDEQLMQISLNVREDIEMTLKRWDDVKKGRKPESFKSSFFNGQNTDNNYKNNISENNSNQNKGGIDLLGFDDNLGGNNNMNMNNNNNLGNDLFDVFSGNNNNMSNMNNQGNDFFNNMGNNNTNAQNNNQNFFGNNNEGNNQNNFNNDFFGNNMNQNNQNQNNINSQGNDFFNNIGNNTNIQNNNQNQNFFGNNNNINQNNQNQNNGNNDLFSQIFNNNANNANINNLQNNLNSVYSETNQFGMNFSNNNNMNNNNTNNFNNIMAFNGANSNNNNFNFNDSNNQNNKNTSNKDFNFNF